MRAGLADQPPTIPFQDLDHLSYLHELRLRTPCDGFPVLRALATVDATGLPHVVPLGWSYNPATDTIDVTGRDFARRAHHVLREVGDDAWAPVA
jgi:hypothetical protein